MKRTHALVAAAFGFLATVFAAEPPTPQDALPGSDAKGTDPEIIGEEKAVLTAAMFFPIANTPARSS